MPARSAPSYHQLLQEARELGRVDGRFAAAFEEPGSAVATAGYCLGRTPADFARLLWDDGPGNPPSGLEVNAPLWYATGFAEGLAAGAAERCTAASLELRRLVT